MVHAYSEHHIVNRVSRASKRNFARRNKTALGPRGQAETSLKIEDLKSNKTNNLKIVEITQKKLKTSMDKDVGPFID